MSSSSVLRCVMITLVFVSTALLVNDLYRTFEVNPLAYRSPIPRFFLPLLGLAYVGAYHFLFAHSSPRSSDESTRRNSTIETHFDGH